jgi:cell division protein ZapA
MTTKPQTVNITIMGKEYRIACEPEEKENLIRSAHELDSQMCKLRDSGKVVGAERIAVMAALNISHEIQLLKNGQSPVISQTWKDCLTNMITKIENVIEKR